MDDEKVIGILEDAIKQFQAEDSWLLDNNLSEQSMSHKLAEHIQKHFVEYNYDVDCEYNGDVDNESGRKRISFLLCRLAEIGLLSSPTGPLEDELIQRAVFPDIIVHKRGNNENNLLVIEVKKSSSSVPFHFDQLKLQAYTSTENENHLNYQLGVFLELNEECCKISCYKDGYKFNNSWHIANNL